MLRFMKLQIFILAIGIAASAGAVNAELNRSTNGSPSTQVVSALITASPSTPKQSRASRVNPAPPLAASQTVPAQSVSTVSTGLLTGVKPSISGISSGENDD